MTNEPLDALRVMALVTDAVSDVALSIDIEDAARQLIARRRPTHRELMAARHANFEVNGGSPSPLARFGIPTPQVPPEVVQLRMAIDEYLCRVLAEIPDSVAT